MLALEKNQRYALLRNAIEHGKNVEDWAIRSQAPKSVMKKR